MYNVELFNTTTKRVEDRATAHTLKEAAEIVEAFAQRLEPATGYGLRDLHLGYVIGQRVKNARGFYEITTAKM